MSVQFNSSHLFCLYRITNVSTVGSFSDVVNLLCVCVYIYTHTHTYIAPLRTYRHLAAKVGTSKGGGKQWQTTPKNLSRMQCARATPVT